MNTLIVYAHPNPHSFNTALRDSAIDTLNRAGHSVLLSDLYAMGFDPVMSLAELKGDLSAIQSEMEKVSWADLLLFQFPDWWYSMPAIMRGWIDRVFAFGFTYDDQHSFENGLLLGKKALICMSVGSRQDYFQQAPERDLMRVLEPIHYGVFKYVGLEVLPPYIVYGPGEMSEPERRAALEGYRQYLLSLDQLEPLRFSSA